MGVTRWCRHTAKSACFTSGLQEDLQALELNFCVLPAGETPPWIRGQHVAFQCNQTEMILMDINKQIITD